MNQQLRTSAILLVGILAVACSDEGPVQPGGKIATEPEAVSVVAAFSCTGSVASRTVSCAPLGANGISQISPEMRLSVVLGGQNINVRLTSQSPAYNSGTGLFTFTARIQNLMSQPMGTTDGITPSAEGIKAFIVNGVILTSGAGSTSVIADGTGTFTAPNQPYYDYTGSVGDQLLSPNEISSPKTWTFALPANATFIFTVLISTDLKYPSGNPPGLFAHYVAMGGSIAAGARSGGIVDSSQADAYPSRLALRAGATLRVPFFDRPGCPAPLTSFVGAVPVPLADCPILTAPVPLRVGRNVSVPLEKIADLTTLPPPGTPARNYNTFVNGPLTQVQVMQGVSPTFVTLGVGDEDAFLAAVTGHLGPPAPGADSALTRLDLFIGYYGTITSAIAGSPALQGAALIGVIDPVEFMPILQPGAFFFLARDAAGNFNGKPVNSNCSPVNALGQPNPLSQNMVSFAILLDAAVPQINCDPAAQNGDYLLDQTEIAVLHARVAAYNTAIQSIASSRNWVFIDPNPYLAAFLVTKVSGRYPWIRKCQDLPSATTAAQFQAAVLNSCPVTGPTGTFPIGGAFFSQDGIAFSAFGQNFLSTVLASAINTKYGTSINTVQ